MSAFLKSPRLYAHLGEVEFQGDGDGLDRAEVSVLDGAGQCVLIGEVLEVLAQVPHVPPVGGGGHAQHTGILEIGKYPLIAVRQGMVGLVHHDHVEIAGGELSQPFLPHKALNGAYGHPVPAVQARFPGLLHRAAEARGLEQLTGGLIQQLPPMGQDQTPAAGAHHVLNDL